MHSRFVISLTSACVYLSECMCVCVFMSKCMCVRESESVGVCLNVCEGEKESV